ncbi:MAG: hypothetical protein ACYS99_12960 [Planctomycetota bacterium]|jgi:hypothetical protein
MAKTALLIIGFAAAGVLGALTATLAVRGESDTRPGGDLSKILARVEAVEAKVDRIQAEMRELRTPPPLPDPRMAPTPLAGRAAVEEPRPALDKELDEKVRKAVEESRDAEQEAIGRRFSAFAEQREKAVLKKLKDESGLSSYQEEEMQKILTRRREAIGEFFRTMFSRRRTEGEETEFTKIQEKIREVAQKSDEEIKALLTPEQYEKFKEEDRMSRRGPWSMGGGERRER